MFDPLSLLVQLAIGVVLAVASVLLAPRPKKEKPAPAKELDRPTAEAGRPITQIWGTCLIQSPNVLSYHDKTINEYEVKV